MYQHAINPYFGNSLHIHECICPSDHSPYPGGTPHLTDTLFAALGNQKEQRWGHCATGKINYLLTSLLYKPHQQPDKLNKTSFLCPFIFFPLLSPKSVEVPIKTFLCFFQWKATCVFIQRKTPMNFFLSLLHLLSFQCQIFFQSMYQVFYIEAVQNNSPQWYPWQKTLGKIKL